MGCWDALIHSVWKRFYQWWHPDFPIDRAHCVMTPLLHHSQYVFEDDESVHGSLVFLEDVKDAPSHPSSHSSSQYSSHPSSHDSIGNYIQTKEYAEIPLAKNDNGAQHSFSDFLMRESVINQQLAGINQLLYNNALEENEDREDAEFSPSIFSSCISSKNHGLKKNMETIPMLIIPPGSNEKD